MSTSISFPQMGKLHAILQRKGVDGSGFQISFLESGIIDDLAEIAASGRMLDRERVRQALGMEPLELRVQVNYSLPIEQLIAAGRYDKVETSVAWHRFPRKEAVAPAEVVCELVELPTGCGSISRAEAILAGRNLRPACLEEMLAFGKTYPGTQRRFTILEIGTRLQRRQHDFAVALWTRGFSLPGELPSRMLTTTRVDDGFHGRLRVLGVKI